jgi:hypothetical protein
MADTIEKLYEAVRTKDQIEGFIDKLEKLRLENEIEDEPYLSTRKDYYRRLGIATSEIARLKNELKEQLAASEHSLELSRKEQASLEVKRKVGELSDAQYEAAERNVQSEIHRLEREVEELNRLINAGSSGDIRVAPEHPPTRVSRQSPAGREAPPVITAVSGEYIAPAKSRGLLRRKLPIIVAGVVVVVIAVVAGLLFLTGEKGGPSLTGTGLETFDIPVKITGAAGIGSLQFELIYDSNTMSPVQVKRGTLPEDALFDYCLDAPGRVVIGMVSAKGISGDTPVAFVTFTPAGGINQSIPLHLENINARDVSTMSQVPSTSFPGSCSGDGASVPPTIAF